MEPLPKVATRGGYVMSRNRRKTKGRKESGSFIALWHAILEHPNYTKLSPRAVKLLIDIYAQYRGNNNGDLCAAHTLMKKRGWKSKDQLQKAKDELLKVGWLMVTRQGGRNKPTLYAVTFLAIDECKGKLDVKPTATAPGNWKNPPSEVKSGAPNTGQVGSHGGAIVTQFRKTA